MGHFCCEGGRIGSAIACLGSADDMGWVRWWGILALNLLIYLGGVFVEAVCG